MIQGFQFQFEIFGAPRTKKNHGRRVKRGNRIFNIPSEAFEQWSGIARKSLPLIRQMAKDAGLTLPIRQDVNCAAIFYREADAGDCVGYQQAVADWMQSAGILADDVQIRQWDGTRIKVDKRLPRINVTLDELPPREKTPRAASRKRNKGEHATSS